jgi:hypothetical protein
VLFGCIAVLMLVFGPEILSGGRAAPHAWFWPITAAQRRTLDLASWFFIVVTGLALVWGPWSMSELETIATDHKTLHFVWSVLFVGAVFRVIAPFWKRIFD